ncbi:MAG: pyrroline-5-carboxylate reductase [Spirochaetales bacterium]|jgi:pyrroline-5-carboxylate reductase|nr:pyrroline-5-carboxylate reductase [Spirochaetales bacterium]
MSTIGFIGAGNMAEAFIKGIVSSGMYSPTAVMASDLRTERLKYLEDEYGIKTTTDNSVLAAESAIVFLSVKPQSMVKMLDGIAGKLRDDVLVISIAAGITTSYLASRLGDVPIIRTMPNTPAMVDEGATAIFNRNASDEALERAVKLFDAVGKTVVLDDENLLDAVTAVSGSGPAYFFLLMEEMVRSAEELGIPPRAAEELVYQTAKGAGVLAMRAYARNESPAELRRKVTSPGGTTEAAMRVFREGNFGGNVFGAIARARDRGKELSEEVEKSNS